MIFFFSSRRRHTRWPRDWSSDVCSSDLFDRAARGTILEQHGQNNRRRSHTRCQRTGSSAIYSGKSRRASPPVGGRRQTRSEERRVGKECRYWWSQYDLKKNDNN